jgi:hypothetical protein
MKKFGCFLLFFLLVTDAYATITENQNPYTVALSLFDKVDTNNNGYVEHKEYSDFATAEIRKLQDQSLLILDSDKNGEIDRTEFLNFFGKVDKNSKVLQQQFRYADKDKSGSLSGTELGIFMKIRLDQYFRQLDTNKDNKISQAEFMDFFNNISSQTKVMQQQ